MAVQRVVRAVECEPDGEVSVAGAPPHFFVPSCLSPLFAPPNPHPHTHPTHHTSFAHITSTGNAQAKAIKLQGHA